MVNESEKGVRPSSPGKVYLVGAGPGHPDLLTVKAYRLIAEADVIVYDRLIQEECIAHAKPSCERIFMGKAPGRHESRQDEINDLIARKALQGNLVVRLKGGDCLLFSRGAEEAEYLAKRGIPFEFVPGVTSALAAPAAAGIPVTHRELSSAFCIITGHFRADSPEDVGRLDWEALAKIDTLAVLMAVKNLKRIADLLLAHGKAPDTPVAIIQQAYWPGEKVLFSTLAQVAEDAEKAGIEPPAVLLVGAVAGARKRLQQVHRDLERHSGPPPGTRRLGRLPGSSLLYPVNLVLEGCRVLVVGGGQVAERRVERLLRAGARVRVVALELTRELASLAEKGVIEWRQREFEREDLEGVLLVFAATNNPAANRRVADEARGRGILVNVADDPLFCDFTLPACVIRDSLVISISTNARAPGLSAALRQKLEAQFGPEWGTLTSLLSELRPELLELGLSASDITKRITNVLNSDILDLIRVGDLPAARVRLRRLLGLSE